MDNFNLRKYLAEGRLLKEWMGINVGGHPRGGTTGTNKFYPKFDKDSLRKALGDADDAIISISGENYIIYNPDSNNQNNADMWIDKSIFAIDKDGEEHEIYYKDIDSIKINEEEAYRDQFGEGKINENQNRQAYLEIGDLLDSDAEWDRDELLDSITMIIDKYYD